MDFFQKIYRNDYYACKFQAKTPTRQYTCNGPFNSIEEANDFGKLSITVSVPSLLPLAVQESVISQKLRPEIIIEKKSDGPNLFDFSLG